MNRYHAVVIGTSAGGFAALSQILSRIDKDFNLPIMIVQHLSPESDNYTVKTLNKSCIIPVQEANEKEQIKNGNIYMAPANYHLLIEHDHTLSLNVDPKVNYCRPSIDVLFETASEVYKSGLIGILLTGANSDGASGLKKIKDRGGVTIVQDPKTAESQAMPKSAIDLFEVDYVVTLDEVYPTIKKVIKGKN